MKHESGFIEEKAKEIMLKFDVQNKFYLDESQFVNGFSSDVFLSSLLKANAR